MSKIGENLRTVVLAIPDIVAIGPRMAQNILQQGEDLPYIWYGRVSEESPICMEGVATIVTSRFSIECISTDIDESIDMADAIRTDLNGHFGSFGDQNVRGIQVEDKDDNYFPRNDTDEGLHVTALDVSIIQ